MIINLFEKEKENCSFKVERSAEFYEKAKILRDFIVNLSLKHEQNDELIALILDQVLSAEKSGYEFGLKIAKEYRKYEKEHDV